MNAPRQGLYAALLALSFALHAALMIQGAASQLASTRAAQGALIMRQLSEDVMPGVAGKDTIALALLVHRYTDRPDVAQVRVLGPQDEVLATGGNAPTRSGDVFRQPLKMDNQTVGRAELTLIAPSRGEIVRYQWLPLILSLLIHGLLWLFYRVAARPAMAFGMVPTPVSTNELAAPAEVHATIEEVPTAPEPKPLPECPLVLQLAFDDPRQLLDTLSPSLAQPYFKLCQTLLDRAIRALQQQPDMGQTPAHPVILQRFDGRGALVGFEGEPAASAEFALRLGLLFNCLAEQVYRRHRESRRFALLSKATLAQNSHGQPAGHHCQSLLNHTGTSQVLVHLADDIMARLQVRYPLIALENPLSTLTREAMRVGELRPDILERLDQSCQTILGTQAVRPSTVAEAPAESLTNPPANTQINTPVNIKPPTDGADVGPTEPLTQRAPEETK